MFRFIYMDFVLSERQKEIEKERQREAELAHSTNTRAGPG